MRSLRAFILILLLMCSVCRGAIIYVNPTSTDDTGDGSTATAGTGGKSAKKTISGAMTAASDGDIIKLVAGTYNDSTQIWSISLPAKSLKIEPDGSSNVTITRTSEGVESWFYQATDNSDYRYIFNNIDFVSTYANGVVFYFQANYGNNIACNDCSFDITTGGRIINATTSATIEIKRRYRQLNCTVESKAYSNNLYDLKNMTLLHIEGGTITSSNTDGSNFLISNLYPYGDIFIKDVAITGEDCIEVRYGESLGKTYNVRIIGCTFTSPDDWEGRAIDIDYNWWNGETIISGADIHDNFIYNFNLGIFGSMSDSAISGNVIYCLNSIIMYGGLRNKFFNNTLKAHDTDTYVGRCLLFNRRDFSDEIACTEDSTFTSSTVTTTDGWDLSNVLTDGTVKVFVKRESGARPISYYGVISSVDDSTDTVTITGGWIKVSDGSKETPANDTYYISCSRFSEQNHVVNNIMDGSESFWVFTFDFNPLDGRNYIDYNCYNVQSGKWLSNLDYFPKNSLTAQRAKWLTWPEDDTDGYLSVSKYNDAHSIEADPCFVDTASLDFRLSSSSPCKNTGKPTLGDGYTSIGAYQFKQYGGGSSTCINPPESDINGDCKVDLVDFAIMCDEWLADGTQ